MGMPLFLQAVQLWCAQAATAGPQVCTSASTVAADANPTRLQRAQPAARAGLQHFLGPLVQPFQPVLQSRQPPRQAGDRRRGKCSRWELAV